MTPPTVGEVEEARRAARASRLTSETVALSRDLMALAEYLRYAATDGARLRRDDLKRHGIDGWAGASMDTLVRHYLSDVREWSEELEDIWCDYGAALRGEGEYAVGAVRRELGLGAPNESDAGLCAHCGGPTDRGARQCNYPWCHTDN